MIPMNIIEEAEVSFKKAIEHMVNEFARLQTGRASTTLVEHVQVEAYGSKQAMKGLANISTPDARTIQIQPWDKGLLQAIEKAIQTSGLNLPPVNDGVVVRVNIPVLTEERRKDLTKFVWKIAEEAKVAIRSSRQQFIGKFKDLEKAKEMSEDELKIAEKKVQERVDHHNNEIDSLGKKKEQDIMSI
ncbi:MAG: ribosome recycling factor, ribosome recycling factor [Candidatus Peregrinibacteria bacterium GW2011_GWF2_38_29]|nr:MAG: ribosome recycling factor, ribosome recycling factor [Candidatus Peregrinibacteria bacterium GW2011_GWF2_38_29]